MQRIVVLLVVMILSIAPGYKANSQNYDVLFGDFDAESLSQADKRFLQAALAFEGHYRGLLDGDWGRLSRNAFAKYSRKEYGTNAENWHMAFLAKGFFDLYERDGWNMRYFSGLGMSVLLPEQTLIVDPTTEHFVNFRHANSSLSISLGIHNRETAQRLHDFTIRQHKSATNPYSVRKTNFAVSSVTKADGSVLYTRSNFLDGSWSTILISAQENDAPYLNAVSSSIVIGKAASLSITPGGKLETVIYKTVAAINEVEKENSSSQPTQPSKTDRSTEKERSAGSGSGFFVSNDGHFLTNAHVVDGCNKILVDGEPAALIEASDIFDLAILKTKFGADKSVAVFSSKPAKLNSDVTVVGFPYSSILGGLNVTRGAVSSLKGLNGDATTMQVTAPVQSGNSGGPLLNSKGAVVGVVVAKLDALRVADATGDMPQNVNFAVRGEIAKLFLAQNGIDPFFVANESDISPEVIAENASKFTAFVECQ